MLFPISSPSADIVPSTVMKESTSIEEGPMITATGGAELPSDTVMESVSVSPSLSVTRSETE